MTSSRQLRRVPPSKAVSSLIVSVHVPFGFSPAKAASASSGTSGVATVLLAYGWSVMSPELKSSGA